MAHRFYVGRKPASWMAAYASESYADRPAFLRLCLSISGRGVIGMKISKVASFSAVRILILALLLPLQACAAPLWYSAEPIQGTVVDAETGQPLEGVIITANWQLEGGIEGSYPVGQMMVMETVTDKNGRYRFPGWGPKRRPLNGRISTRSPQLLVFKSGYRYVALVNALLEESLRGELDNPLRSDWDGKTIRLERFTGTQHEYAENIYDLSQEIDRMLDFARGDRGCQWQKIPRMLVALDKMSANFERQNVKVGAWKLGAHVLRLEDIPQHCGSPKAFLRGYLHEN